jgi:hypothetical protein
MSRAAPVTAQMNSGQKNGRMMTPAVAAAAIPQMSQSGIANASEQRWTAGTIFLIAIRLLQMINSLRDAAQDRLVDISETRFYMHAQGSPASQTPDR